MEGSVCQLKIKVVDGNGKNVIDVFGSAYFEC